MTVQPFEALVEEHGIVVMRVCRGLLGARDAEDAWSETFLAALRAYPRLRPYSNVRGWLTTIAHHKAIDQLRTRARTPVSTDALPEIPISDEVVSDWDSELWRKLGELPFKQRFAVTYHYLGGLPYAEVGALLDSSEAAARRSAADGLAKLRETYKRGNDS